MSTPTLLFTMSLEAEHRRAIEAGLPPDVDYLYLEGVEPDRRATVIADADAIVTFRPRDELDDAAFEALHTDQIVQTTSAGVDHFPLDRLPDGIVLQSNAGAYAEPIAEHVLAMYLALTKRLRIEHRKLQEGTFDQFRPTLRVDGSTCGIFGFGEIGTASASLLQSVGVTIRAINRSGAAEESVEFLGTPDDLEDVLRQSDGVVISAPLTPETRGVIDREKLRWLADDAILINVARGELIDQQALYDHLQANPEFRAGIDTWWNEPARDEAFAPEYPFLDLPNVVGSPHNSAQVPGINERGLERAAANAVKALTTGNPINVVDPDLGY